MASIEELFMQKKFDAICSQIDINFSPSDIQYYTLNIQDRSEYVPKGEYSLFKLCLSADNRASIQPIINSNDSRKTLHRKLRLYRLCLNSAEKFYKDISEQMARNKVTYSYQSTFPLVVHINNNTSQYFFKTSQNTQYFCKSLDDLDESVADTIKNWRPIIA